MKDITAKAVAIPLELELIGVRLESYVTSIGPPVLGSVLCVKCPRFYAAYLHFSI